MQVLIVGSGGREHALAWKIKQSPLVKKLFASPGNAGIAQLADCHPELKTPQDLVNFALRKKIDLTVVGPEQPLVNGLVNLFQQHNLPIFGPTKEAAQIEGSKIFAKKLMLENGIPTAQAAFFSDYKSAITYIKKQQPPYVIKADGLAAGKGVTVAKDLREAEQALADCFINHKFGLAGQKVLVEQFLSGEEVSVLAFVAEETVVPMVAAQDYKRLQDNDEGPNTGGMGAYAPAVWANTELYQQVMEKVLKPTVKALARSGYPYKGVLYAGLILTEKGVYVLEFNARFGDPETQAILPLLDSDLLLIFLNCLAGTLRPEQVKWSNKKAVTVVLAAPGYPKQPQTGQEILGLEQEFLNGFVFHAGTKKQNNTYLTSGGRVLNVCGLGDSYKQARENAYALVNKIHITGCQFRRDIALKAVAKEGIKV